uniref:Uncharacterized protein n=1 Tax=Ditylenchus dipsaci TaxID=166011 RepID=A0A915DY33_9BILA
MGFQLTTRQADILLNLLGPDLQPSTLRSNPLSAKDKLLCALRFYASKSFKYTTAQGPCRESVRCAIRQVTSLINIKLQDCIKWPDNQDACCGIASNFF